MDKEVQDINEGNKLIAEFDGYHVHEWRYPDKSKGILGVKNGISLKIDFSKDWNKIMPVAKRIIDMDLEIKRPLSVEYLSMREKLIWALIDVSIEKIHEHCVKFIQWYNNQQKQVKE